MTQTYQELGSYSDLAEIAKKANKLWLNLPPGITTQGFVHDTLGFTINNEQPGEVRVERRWELDDLQGEEISWSVGYGPRTSAWLIKPRGMNSPLPGIIALHDHGGFKTYGKEKIADGPEKSPKMILNFREICYGGSAFVNQLAKEGFAVLVHDVFLWGSRHFPLEAMPEPIRKIAATHKDWWEQGYTESEEVKLYNAAAYLHEHIIEKYCTVLGTTLAGIISYEDRVATNYLISRSDIDSERIGCIGLSGGGGRSALLQATSDRIKAAVIAGMMTTYEGLLDHNVGSHTWLFFPPGLARKGDWTDLAACRAPSPLMVQYLIDDAQFTIEGMKAADDRIRMSYRKMKCAQNYEGKFYPGPHRFDLLMQRDAFAWLKQYLIES